MSLNVRRAQPGDADRVAELAMKLVEQHVAYDAARFARIATLEGMASFYGGQGGIENTAVIVAETSDASRFGAKHPAISEATALPAPPLQRPHRQIVSELFGDI